MTYERFYGSGEFGDPFANLLMVRTTDSELAFKQLNAQHWIDNFRVETDGWLDIAATAETVGVSVAYEMPDDNKTSQGCTRGLHKGGEDDSVTVHISPFWAENDQKVTFGHELGHIFLVTAAGIEDDQSSDRVEQFCDFFGRQMALPVEKLFNQDTFDADVVADLVEKYGVNHMTVIYQLMLVGKLPRRLVVDSSRGERPNSFYSNKISRHVICLGCEIGESHAGVEQIDALPHLDLTAYDWSDSIPNVPCGRGIRSDIDEHIALNKAYGRWTDTDEALVDHERQHEIESNRFWARQALSDEDLPF